jgi:hypothetical protein
VNARTRWKRRILRDHRNPHRWGHPYLLGDWGPVGGAWGFRTCAHCARLPGLPEGLKTILAGQAIRDIAHHHTTWSEIKASRELQ